MKIDKDMVWIGGIGVILYLLASKRQGSPSLDLPSPEASDIPTSNGLPSGQGKKKSGGAIKSPKTEDQPGLPSGNGKVPPPSAREMAARKESMRALKLTGETAGYNSFGAAQYAIKIYLENGGDPNPESKFHKKLLELKSLKSDFYFYEEKDYESIISDLEEQILELTQLRTERGRERDDMKIRQLEQDAKSGSKSPNPYLNSLNKEIDKITLEISKLNKKIDEATDMPRRNAVKDQIVRELISMSGIKSN